MWTKEETDQLFELCERFDLRFIVIADRFPSSRTVEELKDRYYGGNLSFCWLSLVACCLYGFPLFIFYFISNYSLIEFQICSVYCRHCMNSSSGTFLITIDDFNTFYRAVSRAILIARAPSPADVSGHPLVKVNVTLL